MLEKLQNLVAIEVFFVSLQIRKVKAEVGGGFFRGGHLLPLWPGVGRLFRGGARRLLDLLELRRLSVEGRCSLICTTT